MKLGWVGLGKVGLPMALALARSGGHQVVGYDISDWAWRVLNDREPAPREEGLPELLQWWRDEADEHDDLDACLSLSGGLSGVVEHADVVFVAVQTPHPERFDGTRPMPDDERADFDYTALRHACSNLAILMEKHPERTFTLVVVSTVAPGTLDREVVPLLPTNVRLAYNPSFISLGTVVPDFRNPEFVLIGANDPEHVEPVWQALQPTLHRGQFTPLHAMSIVSAEMTKLACNNYQTLKITWANEVAMLCAAVDADVDSVLGALASDVRKIGSPKIRAGLGDGGPCRVRDAVVLDWLSRSHGLGVGLFDTLLWQREDHLYKLATLVHGYAKEHALPVVVLGKAYKPETGLTHGSPALLLAHILDAPAWDPQVDGNDPPEGVFDGPHVYVVATAHQWFTDETLQWPAGSVVVDPWGVIPDHDGLVVVRVGRQ